MLQHSVCAGKLSTSSEEKVYYLTTSVVEIMNDCMGDSCN